MTNPVWLYWGHDQGMNDLRWLSLASVCHFHTDVRLVLRRGQSTGHGQKWQEGADTGLVPRDYSRLPNLTVVWLEELFPEVAVLQLPEVQTSDMVAWLALTRVGGWVCDTDILFHAPLPNLKADAQLVKFTGTPKVGYIPVTLMGGRPRGGFWYDCWETALRNRTTDRYESCGSEVFNHVDKTNVRWLPEQIVFPFAGMVWRNYKRWLWEDWPGELPGACVGTHWYAGNNQQQAAEFDINGGGLIAKQARKLLERGMVV